MKVAIFGPEGTLGRCLVSAFSGHEIVLYPRSRVDLTNPDTASIEPDADWVINAAAYTAVDRAESEPELAHQVNTVAPVWIGKAFPKSRIVHVSTDFVFDGQASEPYPEDAPTAPLGEYGRSKLAGEKALLSARPDATIVRTAWLFGPAGACFPRSILRAWRAGKDLRVVADQKGTPSYAPDVATAIARLCLTTAAGVFHAAGPEVMSWRDFAHETCLAWARRWDPTADVHVAAIRTEDWPTPAKRPAFSALSTEKLAEWIGPGWHRPIGECLREFVEKVGHNP